MLGRCRLRRGVSLEVIVEEDDNAEVTFDPAPLMEEDDDDDEDDESENGTGGSTPNSPREDDGRERRGDGRDDGESSVEERRRKRERRRTIGGLSRFRSVSCEALTLLDTSDMDSCCSEWDDDDDLASSSSSNYVTLNRPISRRRIIESSQSQCDSEDSGIEYHSNEDDHVLEEHSSNEDHIGEEDLHGEAEEEEDLEEDVGALSSSTEEPTEEEENSQGDQEERREDQEDEDEETTTITTESDAEDISEPTTTTDDPPQDIDDTLLSAKTGKELFEERGKQSPSKQAQNSGTQTGKFDYSPNEALINDKIIIVETTPSAPPIQKQQAQSSGQEAAEEEMRLKREAYTIRNKEVQLEELPRPHTVKSVKQLFENLNTPVKHFHAWRDLGRFRDIKSNPSSKILRFDRSDSTEGPTSRSILMSSLTLPRLPSQGGGHLNTPTNTTRTGGNVPANKSTHHEVEKAQQARPKAPKHYQETPMSKILTQSQRAREESLKSKSGNKSQEAVAEVKTQSGEKVILRKPIVKGFNVKKALMESPRTFQAHNHNNQQKQQQQKSHHTVRHKLNHLSKSHHHSEITDRSDTESLASDISDDSGVSNDSMASTASSSTPSSYRALDAYASDPSFKWIDPAVMAKIRSVGTTVIFFGPRPRPRQEGGTLPRGNKSTSSGLQITRGQQETRGGQQQVSRPRQLPTNQSTKTPASRLQEQPNMPVPAPRIVGVVRKQSSGTNSASSASTSANTSPSPSVHHTPAPTPTPTDAHSDDSRASSPASRCEDENNTGRAGRWRTESDTVVYNFTRPQPPAVYF